ncbi:unnamed protein product [Musa acuminata subsp. burmannicoides]
MVVVKQLKDMNLVEREFKEKIEAIDVMDHSNLVSLMAYYSKDEKLLVDDYMPLATSLPSCTVTEDLVEHLSTGKQEWASRA